MLIVEWEVMQRKYLCKLADSCTENEWCAWNDCVQFHVLVLLLRDLIAVRRGLVHLVRIVTIVGFVWLTTKRSNRQSGPWLC